MHLARVVGTVVCTHKDARLSGVKLMVIQPVGRDGGDVGRAIIATDAAGVGVGERVFFVRGREAAFPFHPVEVPTDASIVGIVDHTDVVA